MREWIVAHPAIVAAGVFFVFSNAVQSLPAPAANSGAAYRWLFGFSHGLAGNIKYALQKALPQYVPPAQ